MIWFSDVEKSIVATGKARCFIGQKKACERYCLECHKVSMTKPLSAILITLSLIVILAVQSRCVRCKLCCDDSH